MKLEGRTALVTGAGKGIGRAIALRFAAEGAGVVIAEIDEAAGRAVVEEITSAAGRALFMKTGVTQEEQVKAAPSTPSAGWTCCSTTQASAVATGRPSSTST